MFYDYVMKIVSPGGFHFTVGLSLWGFFHFGAFTLGLFPHDITLGLSSERDATISRIEQ